MSLSKYHKMEGLDNMDQCLAYQTPPYEPHKKCSCSSPKLSSSSEHIIIKIGLTLCRRTSSVSTEKIKNDIKSVTAFLREVVRRSKSNKKNAVLALSYFNKLYDSQSAKVKLPDFARCAKRIFLSCLILAHKFLNDNSFNMKTWSLISGLTVKDLCLMERWCLDKLDYNLYIMEHDFLKLEDDLGAKKKRNSDETFGSILIETQLKKVCRVRQ